MEHLVEAVTARMHLQRIREHNKNRDSQLPHGDEERRGRIHGYDVGANLKSQLDYAPWSAKV